MTYPNINPIEVGRDGWSVLYSDETSRILFLCGLRPEANVVKPTRTTMTWGVPTKGVIKDGTKTPRWDTPAVKPTLAGVTAALRSLEKLRGRPIVHAILHRYGAQRAGDLGKQWYGTVYESAQRAIRESL
jgi:hypothetical protein